MATLPTTLKFEVATPKGLALSVDASSVQAPSVSGEFGVLPGHLPMIAALRCGVVKYVEAGTTHVVAIDRGFAEAGPSKVVLLTEALARPEDVNVEDVKKALTAAQAKLAAVKSDVTTAEYLEAQRDVQWAEARLSIASN